MELLDTIVKRMLEEHKGGETFFDHLDEAVQQRTIIDQLLCMIDSQCLNEHFFVASGKFGIFLANYLMEYLPWIHRKLIVVEGGLRAGNQIDLTYMKHKIYGSKLIFLDDSFYSGTTRNVVQAEIERLGGRLAATFVVYDGSIDKDGTVHSLYRYYK